MAFDATPTTHLASWSEDGTTISVPIATFPELTAAEADASTGDIRKILFALAEKMYQIYNGMDTADQPGMMRLYRNTTVNDATGVQTRAYTFQFDLDVSGVEVRDES